MDPVARADQVEERGPTLWDADPGRPVEDVALETAGHAPARSSDPDESSQGPALSSLSVRQHAVLRCLVVLASKPWTDEQLVEMYEEAHAGMGLVRQSASGIRSRRKELVDRGLVRREGSGTTTAGNKCGLWWPTPEGLQQGAHRT